MARDTSCEFEEQRWYSKCTAWYQETIQDGVAMENDVE